MRKLFFILILFIVAIIGIVLIYNTVLNTTRQLQPTTEPQLQSFNMEAIIQESLALPTPTTATDKQWQAYQQFLQKKFKGLFTKNNMKWQTFEKYSLVGKWTGSNKNLPPLILIASPATFFEWQDSAVVLDCQSKLAGISILYSIDKMIENGIEPDRTTYVVFPHKSAVEKQIIGALSLSKTEPYMVLKSGGAVAQKDFWGINQSIGFIGIGNKSQYSGQWVVKDTTLDTKKIIQRLQAEETSIATSDLVAKAIIEDLGPEVSFGQKILWSNGWLLSRWQEQQLMANNFCQQLLGQEVHYNFIPKDSNNVIALQWTAPAEQRKEHFDPLHSYKGLDLIDSTFSRGEKCGFTTASSSPTYRMISSTFKEVYKGALTAPCRVQDPFFEYYVALTPNVYYFTPMLPNSTIDKEATLKMGQFYYRLLESTLKQ